MICRQLSVVSGEEISLKSLCAALFPVEQGLARRYYRRRTLIGR
jgi:hypothetical protein